MTDIGAEVGQKMRSAIKAKLMELDCYVDDELPDYIMVMVANKRTKSQMNTDLRLFLTSKTSAFVDWLHIVLKKLKEVHVTNPEVYKKATKRKIEDSPNVKVKKEKKDKNKSNKKSKEKDKGVNSQSETPVKSLTDDLPISANKLSEMRKIIIMQENQPSQSQPEFLNEDSFDIPLLSEVANMSNENELEVIEKRIKNVKNRLGILVESGSEDDDFINIKAEPEDLFPNEKTSQNKNPKCATDKSSTRKITLDESSSDSMKRSFTPEPVEESANTSSATPDRSKSKHERITFEKNDGDCGKKLSVLERLGKRSSANDGDSVSPKRTKISLSETLKVEEEILGLRRNIIKNMKRKEDLRNAKNKEKASMQDARLKLEKQRESVMNRLGVMSKVSIPVKQVEKVKEDIEQEEDLKATKEVPSVVRVKPRVIPPGAKQANKNLLLKAVADAQRSIAQTPTVGTNLKPDALFTKKYKEKRQEANARMEAANSSKAGADKHDSSVKRKLAEKEKNKIKTLITHITKDDKKPTRYSDESDEARTPPLKIFEEDDNSDFDNSADKVVKQQFIVTLDGIDKEKFSKLTSKVDDKPKRKTPSPIIFDKVNTSVKSKHNVPDELPNVQPPVAVKNKERCKYWPSCRLGTKCEFVHPSSSCKTFPLCKFGDKCLFIHPTCKFESSCTRRDCPYSHSSAVPKSVPSRVVPPANPIHLVKTTLQTCKFYPQCTNAHCTFYHPRPCKFGKFCKNQSECNFSHTFLPKNSLTWRSDFKT